MRESDKNLEQVVRSTGMNEIQAASHLRQRRRVLEIVDMRRMQRTPQK